jgi:hypothetical protein
MTQQDFLQPALIGLANLQVILDKKGGPTVDGGLFEEILGIQEDILHKFGLPISPDYEELLWFKKVPSDIEMGARIQQLHSAASDYLLSNAKSELQVLLEAQQTRQDPQYVLPELKIATHIYTIFVYEKILLEQKDSVENILHSLKFSSHYDILNALGSLCFVPTDQDSAIIHFLKSIGVKYVDQFLLENADQLGADDN